jgi:hypothetical protein
MKGDSTTVNYYKTPDYNKASNIQFTISTGPL